MDNPALHRTKKVPHPYNRVSGAQNLIFSRSNEFCGGAVLALFIVVCRNSKMIFEEPNPLAALINCLEYSSHVTA